MNDRHHRRTRRGLVQEHVRASPENHVAALLKNPITNVASLPTALSSPAPCNHKLATPRAMVVAGESPCGITTCSKHHVHGSIVVLPWEHCRWPMVATPMAHGSIV